MPTKVHLVRAMVFPVVMYGCESWTIKKAECQRIDAFELWCWRRLLRVPWPARRSEQSILREISPEYSLEELMLKLKLQYLGHLMQRTDSLEKTLMLGKIESRRGQQSMRWLDGITDLMGMSLSKLPELVLEREGSQACCILWYHKESDMTEQLNWTQISKSERKEACDHWTRSSICVFFVLIQLWHNDYWFRLCRQKIKVHILALYIFTRFTSALWCCWNYLIALVAFHGAKTHLLLFGFNEIKHVKVLGI